MKLRFNPWDVGWRIGDAHEPRGGELWVPWDRTAGVIGPQGSGKTLDLLTPALLSAPGAALVTLTKVEDLLLSLTERSRDDRPCVVLDPFGLAEGVRRRADLGPDRRLRGPQGRRAASQGLHRRHRQGCDHRRHRGRCRPVLRRGVGEGAAGLLPRRGPDRQDPRGRPAVGREPDRGHPADGDPAPPPARRAVLARPAARGAQRRRPHRRQHVTTVQQAVSLFFQADIRRRCVPSHGHPATDLADVIRRRGTIYLLGREDPYASASPLMTAVAEHVLDTGLLLANSSPWGGRLCPPLVSVLDELPSTAPLPTLRTRMANERALGLSFIWAAQTRPQLTSIFGEHEARALLGLTNALVMFGGSKDVAFNQEISDLLGTVRIGRVTHSTGGFNGGGRNFSGDDIPIMRPEEVRQLPERRALVIAENGKPIIAKLHRCVEGKAGERLLADQRALRARLTNDRRMVITPEARATAALVEARRLGFVDDETEPTRSEL